MKPGSKWQPLKRAAIPRGTIDKVALSQDVIAHARMSGNPDTDNLDEAQARALLEEYLQSCEYWINDLYQVAKRPVFQEGSRKVVAYHLNIRRRDGKPIFRDWRHFQQIKNELVGPENEGIELYPAESRLNDTSNKYHIFVFADPTFRFPLGMGYRDVRDDDGNRTPGFRQRKFD